MYTYTLIVKVLTAISPGSLNDIQPHIMNDFGNLLIFFRQSSLFFFLTTPNKSSINSDY